MNSCIKCGKCLQYCPNLSLDEISAKEEIRRIFFSKPQIHKFNNCSSCLSCEIYCPQGVSIIYDKILERNYKIISRKGFPSYVSYLLPIFNKTISPFPLRFNYKKNLFVQIRKRYLRNEKKLIKKWLASISHREQIEDNDKFIFLGCNQRLNPYVFNLSIFNEMKIIFDENICCGEPFYRMGLMDYVKKNISVLKEFFSKYIDKEIIFICPAGYNMFKNIYPKKFNIDFYFKPVYINDWILENINKGKIKLKKKLDYSVTIQDSCHGKYMGLGFLMQNREFIALLTKDIIEPKHSLKNSLCCGLGNFAINSNPFISFLKGLKRLKELEKTNTDLIVSYCNGCVITLSLIAFLVGKKTKIYHTLELLQMALGDEPLHMHKRRAKDLIISFLELLILNFSF